MIVTDGDFGTGDDDIDTVIIRKTATMDSIFTAEMSFPGLRTAFATTTVIRYKFVCDANYYGSYCTVFCVAQDDTSGHYICNSQTGAKICFSGYSGADCDIGKSILSHSIKNKYLNF